MTRTWTGGEPVDLLARAARLAGDADAVERALRAVERRAAGLAWAGPVREAFVEALRDRLTDLAGAAEVLRAEADRVAREAARCGQEPSPGGGGSR